jgi:tetratricopeptide (TPR) repeat protein
MASPLSGVSLRSLVALPAPTGYSKRVGCNLRLWRGGLIAALFLFCRVVLAEDQPGVDDHLAAALRFQGAAERAAMPALAADFLGKAQAEYAAAAKLAPGNYKAHLGLATCLQQLTRLARTDADRAILIRGADDEFAQTAKLPDADWRLYQEWGRFLLQDVYPVASDDNARANVLAASRKVFEDGLKSAAFSGDRGLLQADLGTCLVLLARVSPHASREDLYRKAIDCFDSVSKIEAVPNPGRMLGLWGMAALEIAKLNSSRLQARLAIERFQAALDKDPKQLDIRYNLASAYAFLGEPAQAIRHLRLCLADDNGGLYWRAAAADPDLFPLRREPAFNALFEQAPPGLNIPLVPAPLRNSY